MGNGASSEYPRKIRLLPPEGPMPDRLTVDDVGMFQQQNVPKKSDGYPRSIKVMKPSRHVNQDIRPQSLEEPAVMYYTKPRPRVSTLNPLKSTYVDNNIRRSNSDGRFTYGSMNNVYRERSTDSNYTLYSDPGAVYPEFNNVYRGSNEFLYLPPENRHINLDRNGLHPNIMRLESRSPTPTIVLRSPDPRQRRIHNVRYQDDHSYSYDRPYDEQQLFARQPVIERVVYVTETSPDSESTPENQKVAEREIQRPVNIVQNIGLAEESDYSAVESDVELIESHLNPSPQLISSSTQTKKDLKFREVNYRKNKTYDLRKKTISSK